MDEIQARLLNCFAAVFPFVAAMELPKASTETIVEWDSIAGATLFAVIEEEFALELDLQRFTQFHSFIEMLDYLRSVTAH